MGLCYPISDSWELNVIQILRILVHGVFIPQMIGFYVSAEEGYISLSAIFYLMFLGFYTFPIPGIRRTLGVTFWNWDFDSGYLMVEHWHLRLKFRPATILNPRESFFHS